MKSSPVLICLFLFIYIPMIPAASLIIEATAISFEQDSRAAVPARGIPAQSRTGFSEGSNSFGEVSQEHQMLSSPWDIGDLITLRILAPTGSRFVAQPYNNMPFELRLGGRWVRSDLFNLTNGEGRGVSIFSSNAVSLALINSSKAVSTSNFSGVEWTRGALAVDNSLSSEELQLSGGVTFNESFSFEGIEISFVAGSASSQDYLGTIGLSARQDLGFVGDAPLGFLDHEFLSIVPEPSVFTLSILGSAFALSLRRRYRQE